MSSFIKNFDDSAENLSAFSVGKSSHTLFVYLTPFVMGDNWFEIYQISIKLKCKLSKRNLRASSPPSSVFGRETYFLVYRFADIRENLLQFSVCTTNLPS